MILDSFTLRIVFALTAFTLLALFFSSFRVTRSRYSFSWTAALSFLLAGSALYVLIGTAQQWWAIPAGNALTVIGLVWAWRAVRSLQARTLSLWHFAVPAAFVGAVTALDDPGANQQAGVLVLSAMSALLMGLAARELFLLDARISKARWSLFIASTALSVYYLVRVVAYIVGDAGGTMLALLASDVTTTLITELVLIVVSFSMAELSHDEITERLRTRATRSSHELSEGARVQHNLLPSGPLESDGYRVAGMCVPSRDLSGDFFDWVDTGDTVVITVGDVMGKGVGAAMLGATVRAGLRLARSDDPETTVAKVMDAVGADLTRNNSFVTLFHAHLQLASGRLTILDAGHGLSMLVREDGRHEQISSDNLPLGLGINRKWAVETRMLEPGDRLLVFSDGVLDLFDGSVGSLHEAAHLALSPAETDTESVRVAVSRIEALAEQTERDDDVTVVAIERFPYPARTELASEKRVCID